MNKNKTALAERQAKLEREAGEWKENGNGIQGDGGRTGLHRRFPTIYRYGVRMDR